MPCWMDEQEKHVKVCGGQVHRAVAIGKGWYHLTKTVILPLPKCHRTWPSTLPQTTNRPPRPTTHVKVGRPLGTATQTQDREQSSKASQSQYHWKRYYTSDVRFWGIQNVYQFATRTATHRAFRQSGRHCRWHEAPCDKHWDAVDPCTLHGCQGGNRGPRNEARRTNECRHISK